MQDLCCPVVLRDIVTCACGADTHSGMARGLLGRDSPIFIRQNRKQALRDVRVVVAAVLVVVQAALLQRLCCVMGCAGGCCCAAGCRVRLPTGLRPLSVALQQDRVHQSQQGLACHERWYVLHGRCTVSVELHPSFCNRGALETHMSLC